MKPFKKGSLFDLVHNYFEIYLPKQCRASDHTIRAYRKTLEMFFDFAKTEHKIPLSDLTFNLLSEELFAKFLDYVENERGCSIRTRNQRRNAVRSFFKYAGERDITIVSTAIEIRKIPLKSPDEVNVVGYMSMDAITALISAPDISKPKGLRNRFFMILLYDTGSRIEEMLNLKLSDFRYGKTPTVTLDGKYNKLRTVPLMERTVEHLKQYLEVYHADTKKTDAPLFYSEIHGHISPLTPDGVRKFLRKYIAEARKKCPDVPERVHPHLWRHSRAMHLYQKGMDLTLVSQWLGHVNLKTTLIYAHADTEQKRRAIETATGGDAESPLNISPKRFTISDEEELKRLAGLK